MVLAFCGSVLSCTFPVHADDIFFLNLQGMRANFERLLFEHLGGLVNCSSFDAESAAAIAPLRVRNAVTIRMDYLDPLHRKTELLGNYLREGLRDITLAVRLAACDNRDIAGLVKPENGACPGAANQSFMAHSSQGPTPPIVT